MKFEKLFSPIKIRGLTLPNRVVQSAMGTLMVGKDKKINQTVVDFLTARAKGGIGLVFSQCCGVDEESTPEGFLCIGTDAIAESHKALTQSIHEVGGKVGIQLLQGSICAAPAKIYVCSEMPGFDGNMISAISATEIKQIIEAYGKAAKRAVDAGYDVIEVHCGHGYLIHQFFNASLNRRTDEYGGDFEHRCRFPMEVLKAVRANMPDDMPLFMRITSHDECFEVNTTIDEMVSFAKKAKEIGVDVLDISRGDCMTFSSRLNVPPVDVTLGFNVENAAYYKAHTGMITAAVGRINTPELAEKILEENQADLVVMARAQIADPEFCNKAREGKEDEIVYCIGCTQGCYDPHLNPENMLGDTHITCLRNPAVGKEREYAFEKASNPKKVLIAGGGVGGLEAAYRLKMLGHTPILCEASDHLGGQFVLAGEAPRKGEFKKAAIDSANRAKRVGVDIRLHAKVTPELIKEIAPDAVILAIGSEPIHINLPGSEKKAVYDSHDVLARKVKPEGVVGVIGGGMVGLETAELLASFKNKVKVIEMRDEVAADMGFLRRMCTMEKIAGEDIEMITGARCTEITEEGILAEQKENTITVSCDSIVIAVGVKARSTAELEDTCKESEIPYYIIGDAVRARKALDAIGEGAEIAYKI